MDAPDLLERPDGGRAGDRDDDGSRQNLVNYMEPLGLLHMMGTGEHYGPAPWVSDQSQESWNPSYYHNADATGIGFDRTAAGNNA